MEAKPANMKLKLLKFWIITISFFILTIADFSLTYIATPDLRFEANPLVTVFGLGWPALIVVNIVGAIFFVLSTYYHSIKYERKFVPCKNIKEFYSILFFERPDKFYWIIYKFPKNREAFWAMTAYSFIFVLFVVRITAIFEWILILQRNSWQSLNYWSFWYIYNSPSDSAIWNIFLYIMNNIVVNNSFRWGSFVFMVAFITCILLIPVQCWVLKEYKNNKKKESI